MTTLLAASSDAGRRLVPDFTLSDHLGGTYRLSSRTGLGATIITFYRGHWCPYCRRYLAKIQSHLADFVSRNAQLIAISPEPIATSRALAEELKLSFPLLSDPGGQTIDAYGVRNGFTSNRSLLPHPAVIIVDETMAVRFRSVDRNYKKRTTMRRITQALDEINGAPAAPER